MTKEKLAALSEAATQELYAYENGTGALNFAEDAESELGKELVWLWFAGDLVLITELEAQLAEAQANTAALIEQGRQAGIEEAAREADEHARQAWVIGDREGQSSVCSSGRNHGARAVAQAIRALLTPARDTKADSDGDDGA